MAKAELATEAQISPSHLSDMLYRRKGTTEAVVRRMAMALGVSPETIAPELTGDFVALRPGAEIETGVA
jgi:lambda repressor-like predicted transcriptional regulator